MNKEVGISSGTIGDKNLFIDLKVSERVTLALVRNPVEIRRDLKTEKKNMSFNVKNLSKFERSLCQLPFLPRGCTYPTSVSNRKSFSIHLRLVFYSVWS